MANLRHRYPWLVEGRSRPLNRALYERLIESAREQRPVSIWDLGDLLGLAMDYPPQRTEMAQLLGIISRHEVASGRPLLSSVVVDESEVTPGKELYDVGDDLGLTDPGEDPLAFAVRQQEETFAYWSADEAPTVDEAARGRIGDGRRQLIGRIPPALAARFVDRPIVKSPVEVPPLDDARPEVLPVASTRPTWTARPPTSLRPSTGLTRQADFMPAARQTPLVAVGPGPGPATPAAPVEPGRSESSQALSATADPPSAAAAPATAASPTAAAAPTAVGVPAPTAPGVPGTTAAPAPADAKTIHDAAVRWVMQLERAAGRQPADRREDPTFPGDIDSQPRTIVVRALPGGSSESALTLDASQFAEARRNPAFHVYVVEDTSQGDPTLFSLKILGGTKLRELLGRAWERHYYEMRWPAAHYASTPGMEALADPPPPK